MRQLSIVVSFLVSLATTVSIVSANVYSPQFKPPSSFGEYRTTGIKGKYFDRIFTIIFENTDFANAVKNQPYYSELIKKGVLLTNMHGLYHPSQPNYIAMIHGDRCRFFLDTHKDCSRGKNLVDLLEEKGITWATYQEDYPGNCFTGDSGLYRRKHNPFISMTNIRENSTRCAKIKRAEDLHASADTEQYAFYTPNMDNCGHDTDFTYAVGWLKGFLSPLLKNKKFTHRTLFVLTFDESGNWLGGNRIATVLLGGEGVFKGAKGTTDDTKYDHLSLLRLVEDNWDLGLLGTDDEKEATPIKASLFG